MSVMEFYEEVELICTFINPESLTTQPPVYFFGSEAKAVINLEYCGAVICSLNIELDNTSTTVKDPIGRMAFLRNTPSTKDVEKLITEALACTGRLQQGTGETANALAAVCRL